MGKTNKQWGRTLRYFLGSFLLFLTLAVILMIFVDLGSPKQGSLSLAETEKEKWGWNYEILSGEEISLVEPVFLDEYNMYFPVEKIDAIRIRRVMTEYLPETRMSIQPCGIGVEVFLEGQLIYSDFFDKVRMENGFLKLEDREIGRSEEIREIQFTMPEDYVGKELVVVSYFTETEEFFFPCYPILDSVQTLNAPLVTGAVLPLAVATICAIIAVLLALIFLMDCSNGHTDYRIIFLIIFFLLQLVKTAHSSVVGFYSGLTDHEDLAAIQRIYVLPLFLYISLCLSSWRRVILVAGTMLQFVGMFFWFVTSRQLEWGLGDYSAAGEAVLFLILLVATLFELIAYRKKISSSYFLWYALMTGIVCIISISYYAADWEEDYSMYFSSIVSSVQNNNFRPLVNLFSMIIALMAVIVLVGEFVRRTLRTRRMLGMLEEKNRLTMESYHRLMQSEEETKAVRHEMRHHVAALRGLVQEGSQTRLEEYIHSMDEELGEITTAVYSRNVLVNAIAGTYLERAKAAGIHVETQLLVPEQLQIEDSDLCILLTNLLENAVEACLRMDPQEKRYIVVKMHKDGGFLFLGCKNSCVQRKENVSAGVFPTEKEDSRLHGCGIVAMRKVAEKYNSLLKIDQLPGEFLVKTNLQLRELGD